MRLHCLNVGAWCRVERVDLALAELIDSLYQFVHVQIVEMRILEVEVAAHREEHLRVSEPLLFLQGLGNEVVCDLLHIEALEKLVINYLVLRAKLVPGEARRDAVERAVHHVGENRSFCS